MSLTGDMSQPAEQEDRVWKALADPTRRRVLDLLGQGPCTTGDLCGAFPELCRTAVMKHLDVLAEASLLVVRREGRLRWNYLNPVPIQQICERWLTAHTSRRSASFLDLGRVAEGRARSTPTSSPRRRAKTKPDGRRKR